MNLTMNGPLAQLAAVGVIAVVAMFPSPDSLTRYFDDPVETAIVYPLPEETDAIAVEVPESAEIVVIESPFDLGCIPDRTTFGTDALEGCVAELSSFIEHTPQAPTQLGEVEPRPVVFPDPEIEEARRALALLCQTKWSTGQFTETTAEQCSVLNR